MLQRVKYVFDNKIGLRTFLKSFYVYRKSKAYKKGRQLFTGAFLINGNTQLYLEKDITIENNSWFHLGLHPTSFLPSSKRCTLQMLNNSKLIINGNLWVAPGVTIAIYSHAILEVGNDVFINSNSNLICYKHIKIGSGSRISWDVQICDSDVHEIVREDYLVSKPIEIEDNVWIGSRATILKGVKIGKGSVIASGALVTKDIPENCLVAGVPGKIIRKNIKWID